MLLAFFKNDEEPVVCKIDAVETFLKRREEGADDNRVDVKIDVKSHKKRMYIIVVVGRFVTLLFDNFWECRF
jgi:hypothetical protein